MMKLEMCFILLGAFLFSAIVAPAHVCASAEAAKLCTPAASVVKGRSCHTAAAPAPVSSDCGEMSCCRESFLTRILVARLEISSHDSDFVGHSFFETVVEIIPTQKPAGTLFKGPPVSVYSSHRSSPTPRGPPSLI